MPPKKKQAFTKGKKTKREESQEATNQSPAAAAESPSSPQPTPNKKAKTDSTATSSSVPTSSASASSSSSSSSSFALFSRLPSVAAQLIFHWLPKQERLLLARCDQQLLKEAHQPFAFKFCPHVCLTSSRPFPRKFLTSLLRRAPLMLEVRAGQLPHAAFLSSLPPVHTLEVVGLHDPAHKISTQPFWRSLLDLPQIQGITRLRLWGDCT